MLNKQQKNIALAVIVILIMVSGIVLYINYSINTARQDYDAKILSLSQQVSSDLQDLGGQMGLLGTNLSSQIHSVDANLKSFKIQNQQQIDTLSNLVDQIEQQSSIRLDELKTELKNIRIESSDFSAIAQDVLNSVVSVKTNIGQGSGAVIDAKGYIVTNVHVISDASIIRAVTYSGRTYNANLVGYDQLADIAVLRIDGADLTPLAFGDSDEVKVGEKVIAAGNPAGLSFTVTEGIVSAFRNLNRINYIQTDVPINPGNSGGPLVNSRGEIIGINNFKVGGFESLGFAISSNDVKSVTDKVIQDFEAQQ